MCQVSYDVMWGHLARLTLLDEPGDDTDLNERGKLHIDEPCHQRLGVHIRDRLTLLGELQLAERA